MLNKFEKIFKSAYKRYKMSILIVIYIFTLTGWFLDRTVLRGKEKANNTNIRIINNNNIPTLKPSLSPYRQHPPYKNLKVEYGATIGVKDHYSLKPIDVESQKLLLVQVKGESGMAAYDISNTKLPFSLRIDVNDNAFFITVEDIFGDSVQIRTYQEHGIK